MVNGISVNGLGEVAMDAAQTATNLIGLGNQPNIHPGSITSTGRQRVGPGTATSTQAAQLIGGGISPTLFTSPQTHQLVLGNTSHYPVNNSLMIGDYVTPGSAMLGAQTYRQSRFFDNNKMVKTLMRLNPHSDREMKDVVKVIHFKALPQDIIAHFNNFTNHEHIFFMSTSFTYGLSACHARNTLEIYSAKW
ncbi:hypothetical protein L9F63_018732, partial [Diploptera punctata]